MKALSRKLLEEKMRQSEPKPETPEEAFIRMFEEMGCVFVDVTPEEEDDAEN